MAEDQRAGVAAAELAESVAASRWHAAEPWLVGLTGLYLVGPWWRNAISDMSVFLLASVGLLLLGPRLLPAPLQISRRPVRPLAGLALFTLLGAGLLWGVGATLGTARWEAVPLARTLPIYLLGAWLQQVMAQRYLTLRLKELRSDWGDLRLAFVSGLLFSLFHLPFPDLLLPTLLAGWVWSFVYLRSGLVWPLACSHAVLAVSCFFGVLGRDPFRFAVRLLGL